MNRRWTAWSVAGGLCVAALYTLTPLTVCVVAAAAAILPLAWRGLAHTERHWLTTIVVVALAARAIAIGGLFLRNLPMHDDQFVGAVSGDEAYSMSRALRVRDTVLGSTTTKYDFVVAYDEYGRNSYVDALSAAQVIFGPTPYAVRVLNTVLFTAGALLLFRLCRDVFGSLPAFVGLVVVLFWPTLFAWSISLLKESMYFCLGSLVLTAAIGALRGGPPARRAVLVTVAVATGLLARDLRPSALLLMAGGLAVGLGAWVVSASKRTITIAALAAAAALALIASRPAVEHRLLASLEAAAKTHTGHVFTVGHDYKLLDAGFYLNPQTPAASTLTLTPDEAARFVVRAAASLLVVPAPWQLQSTRELAYLPEQVAWYALVALLPIGFAAGCRRDRLVTCMLVGYVTPTAAALALTNGNVGSLLRLRGVLIPYLVWIGALGFCAVLGTPGRKTRMPWTDENGRLFGRVNLFDAALAALAIVLIPVAYGTFLLFRPAAPHISSVTRVPITSEERRIAGGSRLTAKLKIRGSGLRPMLRAWIGDTQSLGFVFEDPNSADVLVGPVPAGTHDLVLFDGVQEVARLRRSVAIESAPPPRIVGEGTLIHLDKAAVDALAPGALFPGGPADAIVRLGAVRRAADGRWQRPAEILLQCDPDPNQEECAVGGVSLAARPLPIVKLIGVAGSELSFALNELFPAGAPAVVTATVRVASVPELLSLVRPADRDLCLDQRAATVVDVRRAGAGGTALDIILQLGADPTADGWRYRGRVLKAGAPFTLTTERYVLDGIVLAVKDGGGGSR